MPAKLAAEPRLLTVKAAAAYLSTTVWFVRTLVYEKKVPHLRLGNRIVFDRVDLDKFVEDLKRSAARS